MTIFFALISFLDLIVGLEGLMGEPSSLNSFLMLLPVAAVLGSGYLGAWLERRGRGRLVLLVILIGILVLVGSIAFVNL